MNYMAVKKTIAKAVPQVEAKSFIYSKQVWFNVLMTIIGIGAYVEQMNPPAEVLPYSIAVQAIGNIILRVWFGSTPLTFALTSKKK